MKFLNNTKKTRFKIALGVLIFLGLTTGYAIYSDMESVAVTAIAGVLTVGTGYIFGDSYRKSDKK